MATEAVRMGSAATPGTREQALAGLFRSHCVELVRLAYFLLGDRGRAEEAVQGPGELAGTWLLKGTGRVLTITAVGAYEVRDPANVDRNRKGRLTVAADGRVTVTAADDPRCTAVYRPITTPYNAFDAVLTGGGCARLGRAGDQWIRLN